MPIPAATRSVMMTQTINGRSAARINAADLRWIQGEDLVKFRESPSTFCCFAACAAPRASTDSISDQVPGGFDRDERRASPPYSPCWLNRS